jgi:hypothetical protein
MTRKFGVAINCLRRNFEGLAFAMLTVCFLVMGFFLDFLKVESKGVRAASEDTDAVRWDWRMKNIPFQRHDHSLLRLDLF